MNRQPISRQFLALDDLAGNKVRVNSLGWSAWKSDLTGQWGGDTKNYFPSFLKIPSDSWIWCGHFSPETWPTSQWTSVASAQTTMTMHPNTKVAHCTAQIACFGSIWSPEAARFISWVAKWGCVKERRRRRAGKRSSKRVFLESPFLSAPLRFSDV